MKLFGQSYALLQLSCVNYTELQSILWDNDIKSTKQTLKEMIMHHSCLELAEGKAVIKSETIEDLA